MARALFRKAMADLRTRLLQMILVFLMVVAATATLSVAVFSQRAVADAFHASFENNNGVHAWFFTDLGPEHLARIGTLDGVADTAGPYLITGRGYRGLQMIKGDDRYLMTVWAMPAELPTVSTPLLTHGRWLVADRSDEIVLDRVFARTRDIAVGDRLQIVTPAGFQELNVVGLAINADRSLYRVWSPARVFVLPATFDRLVAGSEQFDVFWALGTRLRDAEATDDFIDDALGLYAADLPPQVASWQKIQTAVDEESILTVLFLSVFGVFAVIAAGLVIVNIVGNAVLSQVRDIGLLKAIGFTPRLIRTLFVVEHAALGLVAAVVGAVVGSVAARFVVENTVANLSITPIFAFDLLSTIVIVVGVTLLIALFALMAAWRGGSISTVDAIRTGGVAVRARPSRLARVASALRLPPIVVLGVKDVFHRPIRAWMTILALVLAVMTATFWLSTESIIQASLERPWVIGMDPFDVLVNRGFVPDAEARRIVESRPEVESYASRKVLFVNLPGERTAVPVDALGDEYATLPYNLVAGRMLRGASEVVVSRDLAQEHGLGIGDSLAVTLDSLGLGDSLAVALGGETLNLRVVGEYATFIAAMLLDQATVRDQLGVDVIPDYYGVTLKAGTDLNAFSAALEADSGGRFDVDLTNATVAESIPLMRSMLLGLTAVLLAIAAGNVLASILFAVRERRRDVATSRSSRPSACDLARWSSARSSADR